MIRRPPRSTQSRSSAASDVYKRQLRRRFGEVIDHALQGLLCRRPVFGVEDLPQASTYLTAGLGRRAVLHGVLSQVELAPLPRQLPAAPPYGRRPGLAGGLAGFRRGQTPAMPLRCLVIRFSRGQTPAMPCDAPAMPCNKVLFFASAILRSKHLKGGGNSEIATHVPRADLLALMGNRRAHSARTSGRNNVVPR